MLRRTLLAVAFALPVAAFAGHGALAGGVAHAQGTGPGAGSVDFRQSCDTSYTPTSPGPFYLSDCSIGEQDGPTYYSPDNDDDNTPTGQNWQGTVTYSGSGCLAASIKTGELYYNPTSYVEFDSYNQANDTVTIHTHCTVQTGDTGITKNLLATFTDVSGCNIQFDDYGFENDTFGYPYYTQAYETESPTGVVTLSCNANLPLDYFL